MSMSKDQINVGLFDRVKQLETERNALKSGIDTVDAMHRKASQERDELRAEVAEWKSGVRHLPCEHMAGMLDFAEQTAEANRKAEELRAEVERLKAENMEFQRHWSECIKERDALRAESKGDK